MSPRIKTPPPGNEAAGEDADEADNLNPVQRRLMGQFCKGKMGALHLAVELRIKTPGKARGADFEGSRTNAIHLFCYQCMGGSKKDAGGCESYTCPLWQYRPNPTTGTVLPPGILPSQADLQALLDAKTSDAQRERHESLRKK